VRWAYLNNRFSLAKKATFIIPGTCGVWLNPCQKIERQPCQNGFSVSRKKINNNYNCLKGIQFVKDFEYKPQRFHPRRDKNAQVTFIIHHQIVLHFPSFGSIAWCLWIAKCLYASFKTIRLLRFPLVGASILNQFY
jgi:hypothetical protein